MSRAMTDDLAPLEPHGPLVPLFDDVFTLQGSVVMMPLVRIPRTMTIVRHDGDLTLINAVRVDDATLAELNKLGAIKNVVRIGMHGMDDAWYVQEQGATLWALPGVEHGRGQTTAQELSADNAPFPNCEVFAFAETVKPEAALLLKAEGGVLITCDSVQNWESTEGCSLVGGLVTRVFGFVKPAQIGPPWHKMMRPEGGSLQADFERLVALDFRHLIGGHGVPLKDTAKERLQETLQRVFA